MSIRRLATLVPLLAVAGCAVGERPTLGEASAAAQTTVAPGAPTGNAEADRILSALEQQSQQATFTAKYQLTRTLGNVQGEAVVAHRPGATAVTIGDWTFIQDGQDRTCQVSTNECLPGVLLQRVSDLINTDGFWAKAPALQIRRGLVQRAGDVSFSAETVAGQASNCISIPFPEGTEMYCVAPNGIESLTQRNDLVVRLTELTTTFDETLLRRP